MNKITKKRVIIAIAIAVLCVGFYIERKSCQLGMCQNAQKNHGSLVKSNDPLTIHNETGAKVNAAFYNKRLKRSGSVIRVDKDSVKVKRRAQGSYLAVARNGSTLSEKIESTVPRTKVRRARCVKIGSKGLDLVVTPTKVRHQH